MPGSPSSPRRPTILLVVFAMVLVPRPAVARVGRVNGTDAHGLFWGACFYSHSARDDPIMLPGRPGASHLHDFFGNDGTSAVSTTRSMVRAPTRCQIQGDRSGYWSPAAYLNGVRLPGVEVHAYYLNFFAHSWVHTIPFGLRMVAGNRDATSPEENPHAFWSCGGLSPKVGHPYECAGRDDGQVVAGVDFPSCWDGTGTGLDDVAYPPVLGSKCPAAFPVALPVLSLRMLLGVVDPCAGATPCGPDDPDANVAISLASGDYSTLHADFWNVWSPATLRGFVRRCLDAHTKCNRQIQRPTIPGPPLLHAGPMPSKGIRLRWAAPATGGEPVIHFRVYRSTGPAQENTVGAAPIAVVGDAASWIDTGVEAGTRYFYRVVAANALGAGELSNEASARAP